MKSVSKRVAALLAGALVIVAAGAAAQASSGAGAPPRQLASPAGNGIAQPGPLSTTEQLKSHFAKTVSGKTVAWVPLGMGTPLMEEWTHWIQYYANYYGMKFEMRDPNWDPTRQVQAVQAFINQKPAILIVHNLDAGLLANLLKQAEQKGIYVLQVNMESNYKTDVFVGGDFIRAGQETAQDIVKQCGPGTNTSHKVALIDGDANSGATQQFEAGATPVFEKGKIKIVARQSANWDRTKAHDIAATVLKSNPDLCAIMSHWDQMAYGAAQAVKEAGLLGKVKVYTADASTVACQGVGEHLFAESYGYSVPDQGKVLMAAAAYLLQSGRPPGATRTVIYTPLVKINSSNWNKPGVCYDGTGNVVTVKK